VSTDIPQPPPLPAAPVTILDVFTKQVEMGAQLAVIHEQLKMLPDHEQRLRVLEASRAKLYGVVVTVAAAVSAAGTWAGIVITRH